MECAEDDDVGRNAQSSVLKRVIVALLLQFGHKRVEWLWTLSRNLAPLELLGS